MYTVHTQEFNWIIRIQFFVDFYFDKKIYKVLMFTRKIDSFILETFVKIELL